MTLFLNYYTLKYTPLSPIHIGTGDGYEPTNYVIDDNTLYEFDTGGAMAALSAQDRTELDKITKGKPDTQMLKAVQAFFYHRRDALKPWAINAIPVLDGVAKYYVSRVGQAGNREGNGKEVLHKLEIDRTAYNPVTRQPVLFGSSVKGAIRTALLNHVNNKATLSAYDANLFELENLKGYERKQREREQKKVFPRLNERLFQFRAGKFELDPLRLVQISDAAWNDQNKLPTAQVLITVNRKKHKVVDEHGIERPSQTDSKENLNKLLECVPAWRYRTFTGQLNLQRVNNLPYSTKTKLPKDNLCFTVEKIAQICSAFYVPILKAEIDIMRDRGFLSSDWDKNIQELFAKMTDKLMKGNVFLLRVGRHSGTESMTLHGVRHIKIMKGDPEYQQQTKTLWLAAEHKDQRTDLLPFGWVLVEVESDDTPMGDWLELVGLCASQHKEAQKWTEKQVQQKYKLEQDRYAAEQRREREDMERRQQLELIAQAEQARLAREQAEQQRLANLSPIDQELEAFLKTVPEQEWDTQLLQELTKGRWQGEDGKVVAAKIKGLMIAANKWMPDFTGSNKPKLKFKERSQKVLGFLEK
ncbi:MAG: RAMP superfamily CRISPR-associated protein [Methylococcaceae bacterium]